MKSTYFRNSLLICIVMITISTLARSNNPPSKIKEEAVTYKAVGLTFKGFFAFDENIIGTRPVVLVVHEWWGLNEYTKMRAR